MSDDGNRKRHRTDVIDTDIHELVQLIAQRLAIAEPKPKRVSKRSRDRLSSNNQLQATKRLKYDRPDLSVAAVSLPSSTDPAYNEVLDWLCHSLLF